LSRPLLGVNVAGFFRITQFAIAEMEKQGSGHVVQISTSLVDHANSNIGSKAGERCVSHVPHTANFSCTFLPR